MPFKKFSLLNITSESLLIRPRLACSKELVPYIAGFVVAGVD